MTLLCLHFYIYVYINSNKHSLNYISTLKMEAIGSSETSGTTLRTTRRHILEYDTLQNHRSENLKSYKLRIISIVRVPETGVTQMCTKLIAIL
jgi:hypothetical protein